MKNYLSQKQVIIAINKYLVDPAITTPFFLIFDSCEDILFLQNELTACRKIMMSNFCASEDAFPNEDQVYKSLLHHHGSTLLLGVGEYIALKNDSSFLNGLIGLQLHNSKVIIPVWNAYTPFEESQKSDIRLDARRVAYLFPSKQYWRYKRIKKGLSLKGEILKGFLNFLHKVEMGYSGDVIVETKVPLNPLWGKEINSSFEVFCEYNPSIQVPQSMFSEKQWGLFLDETRERDTAIESADSLLNFLMNRPDNHYLQLVIKKTKQFKDYSENLLNTLFDVPISDMSFSELYLERKKLIANMPADNIRNYVLATERFPPLERMAYLTENTSVERMATLAAIVEAQELPKQLEPLFPNLELYLRPFSISLSNTDNNLAELLTNYFQSYKRQKLFNQISPEFLETVENIAIQRPYFSLPSRGSILEKLQKESVVLFWIDAFGCEFLSYIQAKAEELSLKLNVHIARAALPTITSVNRAFYDVWSIKNRHYRKKLDDIKHGEFNDFGYNRSELPVQLDAELLELDYLMRDISNLLKGGSANKIVLASDHGATRLAIISKRETSWEMPEKGKYGGRCCKASEFDGSLPDCATQDDDRTWHVLANYDRFKGSRESNVEVHGGASLEEIVVPVIEFTLLDKAIYISLENNVFTITNKTNFIEIFFFSSMPLSNAAIDFDGVRYCANALSQKTKKYLARLPRLKAGKYEAIVLDGDTRISKIEFSVQGGGVNINDNNDFFGED